MRRELRQMVKRVIAAAAASALLLSGCTYAPEDASGSSSAAATDAENTASENAVSSSLSGTDTKESVTAASSTDNSEVTTQTGETTEAENTTASGDYKYRFTLPALGGGLCSSAFYIAKENGYFDEEGLDVTLVSANTETLKTGINNGTIPFTYGDFQYFQSMEQGIKGTVVDAINTGCIQIIARSDDDSIQSAADLKGKTVCVNSIGGTPYQILNIWASEAGLTINEDYTVVAYSDGNLQLQALKSGEVDVAAVWDPYGPKAVQDGYAKLLFDNGTDGEFAGRACCFLVASTSVLEEHPDEIAATIRALHKADQWISENPEKTVQVIVDKGYQEVDDADLAAQLLKSYGYDEISTGDHDVQGDVEFYVDKLNKLGLLTETSDEFISQFYQKVDLDS